MNVVHTAHGCSRLNPDKIAPVIVKAAHPISAHQCFHRAFVKSSRLERGPDISLAYQIGYGRSVQYFSV